MLSKVSHFTDMLVFKMQMPSRSLRHISFQIQATSCLNYVISWIWDNFTSHHGSWCVHSGAKQANALRGVAGLQEERKRWLLKKSALIIWQSEEKYMESNLFRGVENTRASLTPTVHWTMMEELRMTPV